MALFTVKSAAKNGKKPLKVVIGKNVIKGAVGRNLIKRRIRAAVRPFIKKTGETFVIIVKPGAANLSYKELKEELIRQMERK